MWQPTKPLPMSVEQQETLEAWVIEAIQEFIHINNQNPKPFVWTKKVEQILERVGHCKAVTATLH